MPGLSWGLAAIVTVAGLRMLAGRGVWLPASTLDRGVAATLPTCDDFNVRRRA